MNCPSCGHENPVDSNFCGKCGSPLREERPLRIVRDAASIAAHTTGYFRGWRRGQEIGGYAIGGRPGREAAGGWDFSRDGQPEPYNDNAGYRSN